MLEKYRCKIVKREDEHTRADCEFGDEDNYTIEPIFGGFPEGALAIARQFGPNETDDESDRNVHLIVIEKRHIVDELKDFLSSTRNKMEVEHSVGKEFDITYKFEKESHGWLRVEGIYKQGEKPSIIKDNTVEILIHKDVVPFMKQIVDQNFT